MRLCRCVFAVIRAKLVERQEVDVGNDIYGNPVKQIKFGIKQMKVGRPKAVCPHGGSSVDVNVPSFLTDVQGSQPGHRCHLHGPLLCRLWGVSAG